MVYYGPDSYENVVRNIQATHKLQELKEVPAKVVFEPVVPKKDRIFIVDYDSPQTIYYAMSFGGKYNQELTAAIRLYNEYFGGSMNAIVFQELREARALAYTAMSTYRQPSNLDDFSQNISYIACGKDKLIQSVEAFDVLLGGMPQNQAAFDIAKESIINGYRTSRVTKDNLIWTYLGWQKLGLNEDPRPATYEKVKQMTLQDIVQFQKEYVSGQPRTIAILGSVKDMDIKALKKIGKVKVLKQETIFGY